MNNKHYIILILLFVLSGSPSLYAQTNLFSPASGPQSMSPIVKIKKVSILCAYKDKDVLESCNKEAAKLKSLGYEVQIVYIDENSNVEILKKQLIDSELIILDVHGKVISRDPDDDYIFGASSEDYCLTESEIRSIIPGNCDLIVNTCHAGAMNADQCGILVALCQAGEEITFPISNQIMNKLLECYHVDEELKQFRTTTCKTFETNGGIAERQSFIGNCIKEDGRISDPMPIAPIVKLICTARYDCSKISGGIEIVTSEIDMPNMDKSSENSCVNKIDSIYKESCDLLGQIDFKYYTTPAKEQLCCIDRISSRLDGTNTGVTTTIIR